MKKTLILATIIALPAAAAQAEPKNISGYVGLGVAAVPDFEGSSDRQIIPLATAKVNYDKYYVETAGLGLRANVSQANWIEFGPTVAANLGRDNVDNNRIDRMKDIDPTVEVGGFVKLPFRQVLNPTDELSLKAELLTDAGGVHDGTTVSFGPSYSYSPAQKWRIGTGASATYASSNYTNKFYGVSARDSARSGLPTYKAEGGIKDVGLSANANYQIDEKWGVLGIVSYKSIIGDAADSPIVEREGSANQTMIGTGVSYMF